MIDQIVNWHDIDNYSYVFIDEAHRFRNADSQTYQYLKEICYGKKVILITATPQNNTIRDIANLITLFQDARKSSIMPNCPDLDAYFKNLVRMVKESKKTDEYEIVISQVAERIRNDILRHVMVRRTRSEIKKFYSDDIKNQGLTFPKVNDPVKLTYEYSPDMEEAFLKTIKLLKDLTYARYTPLLFAKDQKAYADKKSGQQNLKAFIKTMLVKRLESSIYAFVESLKRLKQNSKDFIDFFDRGYVIIGAMSQSNKINVDKLLMMTDDEVEQLVYEKDVTRLKKEEFVDEYSQIIRKDDMILSQLIKIWDHFNIYNDDEKFDILLETIKNEKSETKIIVFSEAKDTVEHIEDKLSK